MGKEMKKAKEIESSGKLYYLKKNQEVLNRREYLREDLKHAHIREVNKE